MRPGAIEQRGPVRAIPPRLVVDGRLSAQPAKLLLVTVADGREVEPGIGEDLDHVHQALVQADHGRADPVHAAPLYRYLTEGCSPRH